MITFELIGSKIRKFRNEKRFSQQYIAEKLQEKGMNISRETFNKIENGNRTISALEVANIANILSITTESLINEIKEEKDLTTLFRKKYKLSTHAEEFLVDFEDFTRALIGQKEIAKRGYTRKGLEYSWKKS